MHAHSFAPDAPYTLLVTDIDGTLLDEAGRLPAANVAALRRWVDGGRTLALATGRNRAIALPIARALQRDLYLILQDGALTLHFPSMRVLGYHNLASPLAEAARRVLRRAGLPVLAFDPLPEGESFTLYRHGPLSEGLRAYLRPKRGNYRRAAADAPLPPRLSKLVTLDTAANIRRVGRALHRAVPQARVLVTEAVRLRAWFLEVGSPHASKVQGVQTLLAHLHLPPSAVIAIGDAESDIEMLQLAGLGVAMGNASARVRAAADRVIRPNAEAGLAHFLASLGA